MSTDLYVDHLYAGPDGGDVPSIWRARPDNSLGDEQVLVRTGANAVAFDALATLLEQQTQLRQLAAELTDFHGGHGDYLSAGKSLTAILEGGAR